METARDGYVGAENIEDEVPVPATIDLDEGESEDKNEDRTHENLL